MLDHVAGCIRLLHVQEGARQMAGHIFGVHTSAAKWQQAVYSIQCASVSPQALQLARTRSSLKLAE